jgi:hypothetical protein
MFVGSHYYSESKLCAGVVLPSYNAQPTSRKRAADRQSFRNFLP